MIHETRSPTTPAPRPATDRSSRNEIAALLQSAAELIERSTRHLADAAAALDAEDHEKVVDQLLARDPLLGRVGDATARLLVLRGSGTDPAETDWSSVNEAEWQRLATALLDVQSQETELTNRLVAARQLMRARVTELDAAGNTRSAYRRSSRHSSIDRTG